MVSHSSSFLYSTTTKTTFVIYLKVIWCFGDPTCIFFYVLGPYRFTLWDCGCILTQILFYLEEKSKQQRSRAKLCREIKGFLQLIYLQSLPTKIPNEERTHCISFLKTSTSYGCSCTCFPSPLCASSDCSMFLPLNIILIKFLPHGHKNC